MDNPYTDGFDNIGDYAGVGCYYNYGLNGGNSTSCLNNMFISLFTILQKNETLGLMYTIRFPFIPDPAPDDLSNISASIFPNNSGSITSQLINSNNNVYYNIYLKNSDTMDVKSKISNYSSNDCSVNYSKAYTKPIVLSLPNEPHGYYITVDVGVTHGKVPAGTHAEDRVNVNINWLMQFVYTNTYNIFQ